MEQALTFLAYGVGLYFLIPVVIFAVIAIIAFSAIVLGKVK